MSKNLFAASRLAPLLCLASLVLCASPRTAAAQESQASRLAVRAATQQHEALLRRIGLLAPGARLKRISRFEAPQASISHAKTAAVVRDGSGPLKFSISSKPGQFGQFGSVIDYGFVADRTTGISPIYDELVSVYGDPAPSQRGITIPIVYDSTRGDGYLTSAPGYPNGIIYFDPFEAGKGKDYATVAGAVEANNYSLARLMLLAFRGASGSQLDAWEVGMADAAALRAFALFNSSPSDFDPTLFTGYILPFYDLFNRPQLGGKRFYSPPDTATGKAGSSIDLAFYREEMAQAAWLKASTEDPNFFRLFNASLYARAASIPHVADDENALRDIGASVLPQVEKLNFYDWCRRQQVLEANPAPGEKLWIGTIPYPTDTVGYPAFLGLSIHYRVLPDGGEIALGGVGRVRAFNDRNEDITAKSPELRADDGNGNQVIYDAIPGVAKEFGSGEFNRQYEPNNQPAVGFQFSSSDDFAQGRITLKLAVGGAEAEGYFPFNVAGTFANPKPFFGAVVGANSGTIGVQIAANAAPRPTPAPAPLTHGAFAFNGRYPSAGRVQTTFTLHPTGSTTPRLFGRNAAWSFYDDSTRSLAVLLETAPGEQPFRLALKNPGTAPLRMISLPFYPLESDEADILGVPATALRGRLARRRPAMLAPVGTRTKIDFGIREPRHGFYPYLQEPFAPGRGYWIALPEGGRIETTALGGEPTRAKPFEVPLQGGWNQFGLPWNLPTDIGAIRVRYGSEEVAWAEAVRRTWVLPGVWAWNSTGGYLRVDAGSSDRQKLKPFAGYYIFTRLERGLKLVFNASATTAPPLQASGQTWQLALLAESGVVRDELAYFGVSPTSSGVPARKSAPKPPPALPSVTLAFDTSGNAALDNTGAGAEQGWAESFYAPFASGAAWRFIVDGAKSGQAVTLYWGDVAALPSNFSFVLVDEASGARVPLASSPRAYHYTSNGGARRFKIEAKLRSSSGGASGKENSGPERSARLMGNEANNEAGRKGS